MILPHQYPDIKSPDGNGSWDWDRDTLVEAQGLKAAPSSFHTIAVFTLTKSILDIVRDLATKLQKRDEDRFEAYSMLMRL